MRGPQVTRYEDADYTGTWRVKEDVPVKTYGEFLKMVQHLTDHADEVFLTRWRRGQWGEWCETWRNVNGKATIVKQGWS
jgi:peptide deformylase